MDKKRREIVHGLGLAIIIDTIPIYKYCIFKDMSGFENDLMVCWRENTFCDLAV